MQTSVAPSFSCKLPPLPLSSVCPRLLPPWLYSVSSSPVRVPDAGIYMVGLAVFPSLNHLHHAPSAPLSSPQPPSHGVEVGKKSQLIWIITLFSSNPIHQTLLCVFSTVFLLRCCCSQLWVLFRQVVFLPLSLSLRTSAHKSTSEFRSTDLTVIIPACTCCYPVSQTPSLTHTNTVQTVCTFLVSISRC